MNNRYATSFLDALFCFLLVFVVITSLIRHSKSQEPARPASAVFEITLTWEGNADLDLWVQDPQGRQIGFSRREGGDGSLASLNRDCLGARRTETNPDGTLANPLNEEVISIRGIMIGECIVNVHSYNMNDSATPLKATVKLTRVKPYEVVVSEEKEFGKTGEELTFFRFSMASEQGVASVTDINRLPTSILHP